MTALDLARELGHEEVVLVQDPASGFRGVIAIHDTTFGPAVGGTRMRPCASMDDAVTDALRLSRAMTYKAAMAGVERGGAALGVFESIRAAARVIARDVTGLRVAVQGLGQVGYRLAKLLAGAGARLSVADVDGGRVERAVAELGAAGVSAEAVYDVETEVFSPNAGGSVLNDDTVPRLRCRAVVGGANAQLAEPRHGDLLFERGILFGPDYVVNAGGLLSLLFETGEADEENVTERVKRIGNRVADIWRRSREENVAPHRMADRIVEERLAAARAGRRPGKKR